MNINPFVVVAFLFVGGFIGGFLVVQERIEAQQGIELHGCKPGDTPKTLKLRQLDLSIEDRGSLSGGSFLGFGTISGEKYDVSVYRFYTESGNGIKLRTAATYNVTLRESD